jgi:hypothetical protein
MLVMVVQHCPLAFQFPLRFDDVLGRLEGDCELWGKRWVQGVLLQDDLDESNVLHELSGHLYLVLQKQLLLLLPVTTVLPCLKQQL